MDSWSTTAFYKRYVNQTNVASNPCCSFRSLKSKSPSAPENLMTSFAMSPIFFNHPNTTNSIKLLNSWPQSFWTCSSIRAEGMKLSCSREIWFNQQPKFYVSVLIYPIIAVGCLAMSNVLWRWAFHILYCFLLTKRCLDFCSFVKWNNRKKQHIILPPYT